MGLSLAVVMERTGLPASTIHHYRRAGLLPPLAERSGREAYDATHVEALLQIRRLRDELGLSLGLIAEVLPEVLSGDGHAACEAASARQRVLDAATGLFSLHSYGEVTIAEVAAAAGMAKGSVYRHFSSKEELFTAVVESLMADTAADFARAVHVAAGPDGVVADRSTAAQAFAGVVARSMPILLELGARAAKGHDPSAVLARRVLSTLATAAGAPLAAPGTDPAEAGLALIEEAFAVVLRWSLQGRWVGDGDDGAALGATGA